MTPGERIANYACRHWLANRMEKWPTVRTVARGLGISQRLIEECSGDGWYDLTMYNVVGGTPLGDQFVEADTSEVEAAWLDYWKSFTPQCFSAADIG